MICANPECDRAGIELPLSEFNKNRRTCRQCDLERAKEHRKKEWLKRKQIIDENLGTKCVICGETRDLRLGRTGEEHGIEIALEQGFARRLAPQGAQRAGGDGDRRRRSVLWDGARVTGRGDGRYVRGVLAQRAGEHDPIF